MKKRLLILFKYKKMIIPALILFTITVISVLGYMWMEQLSFFDALWLSIVSMLTIGYGDLSPVTTGGKLLTLVFIPLAIGLSSYVIAQFIGSVIGGALTIEMRKRKMQNKISLLENHIIVCGYGRVGKQVVRHLIDNKQSFVIIEQDNEALKNLPEELLYIEGDATDDEILVQAGVKEARGIVITMPKDSENVFITLSVKGINPSIYVVARTEKFFSEEKLYRAGANKVINTANIGGRQMAMSFTKPISVEYMDTVLHDKNHDYSIEEILIHPESVLANKSLAESKVREQLGTTVVAIKRREDIINNPNPTEILLSNDLVIVFGSNEQLKLFERAAGQSK